MVDQATETQNERPAYPKLSGEPRADSAARAAYEGQLAAWFEKNPSAGFRQHNAPTTVTATGVQIQPGQATPNADDLALIEASHKDLAKRFPDNSQAREVLERARMDVFAGKPLDREAISVAFGKAIETPADRETAAALAELSKAVDAEGGITPDKLPARLTHGYKLPAGVYDAEQTVALLNTAKQLGLTQSQVDQYIAMQGADE